MRWNTYPIRRRNSCGGRSVVSTPSSRTEPAVGSIRRLTILRVVVFPEPEPPSRTTSSPASTFRLKSSTTTASP